MRRATIDYGRGPAADEFEITIFGPGYGEAIAVHLGCQRWLLVDSCVETNGGVPATADYLGRIGVSPERVQAIVASHWHDDHVRGMSQLVGLYPDAIFFFPAVLSDRDAGIFLSAYSGVACSGLSRGTKELYLSLRDCERGIPVKSRVEVVDGRDLEPAVRVMAFSPTDAAFSQFLARILEYIPRENASLPIGHAPVISPNLSSIVLHVELGGEAILLGADLERHTAGWDAIVADPWCCTKARAGLVKIAHHGSHSGDHPGVWSALVGNSPLALLSPFNNGRHILPTQSDVTRILGYTERAFITSLSSKKPRVSADQLKRLQDMCTDVAPVNSGFGAVRARRGVDSQQWTVELFGSAGDLRSRHKDAA
jgi:hypothetical protein